MKVLIIESDLQSKAYSTERLVELKEALSYCPKTGIFRWKKPTSNRVKVGDVAGSLRDDGYVEIRFKGVLYSAAKLAWWFTTGDVIMPDHKNRVRHDNSIENLRPATYSQNLANRLTHNAIGFRGVSRTRNGFAAQICCDYQVYNLGTFASAELAHAAYKKKAKELFGEFADE